MITKGRGWKKDWHFSKRLNLIPRKYSFSLVSVRHHDRVTWWKWIIKFHLECMLRSCAQRMLRKMHSTDVSISIEAKYLISWLSLDINEREDQLWNSSFCTKTADWKSRWPHGNQDVLELTPANVPPGLLWHCQAPGRGAWGLCTVQRLSDDRRCRWRFLRIGSARCGTLSQLCRKWTPLVRSCSRTLCVVYIQLWTGWRRLEDEESVQRRTTSMTLTSDSQKAQWGRSREYDGLGLLRVLRLP